MWFERVSMTRRHIIEMKQKEQDDDNSIEEIKYDEFFISDLNILDVNIYV